MLLWFLCCSNVASVVMVYLSIYWLGASYETVSAANCRPSQLKTALDYAKEEGTQQIVDILGLCFFVLFFFPH